MPETNTPTKTDLACRTKALLSGSNLQPMSVLVGFDGFIDTILHAVDRRLSPHEFTRIRSLSAFGERIAASAERSTNIEVVPQSVRLGGNGPILANSLALMGADVTYCGMVGYPKLNEVFRDFSTRARVVGIAEPGTTNAYEFDDGKLLVGCQGSATDITYANIKSRLHAQSWYDTWNRARLVAMVNWTMLPYMTEVWKEIQSDATGYAGGGRKILYFDLADPEKRSPEDLVEALLVLARFEHEHDVVLGLNEKESLQVADVLGLLPQHSAVNNESVMAQRAHDIRERLQISICLIHPTRYAVAASTTETYIVQGPWIAQPKLLTGAGDHFNAGFCAARLLGFDLEAALQVAVATSGYYVGNAASPTLDDLTRFLTAL